MFFEGDNRESLIRKKYFDYSKKTCVLLLYDLFFIRSDYEITLYLVVNHIDSYNNNTSNSINSILNRDELNQALPCENVILVVCLDSV